MTELEQILRAADEARSRGVDCVLATVVRVAGSTYRRPGARMLLTLDGARVGAISGGCLEREVQQRAAWLTQSGRPVVLRYDTSSGDDATWEFGLGCRGVVWVLMERLPAGEQAGITAALRRGIESRAGEALATVVATDGDVGVAVGDCLPPGWDARIDAALRAAAHGRPSALVQCAVAGGLVEVFVELIQPPPPLLICGAGHDAAPLVRLAAEVGWAVTVIDSRAAYAAPQRFPQARRVIACKPGEIARHVALDARSSAVVMTHNAYDDVALLRALLPSPIGYVGLLGPRSRADAVLQALKDERAIIAAADMARLHAPIGLDLGAETPAEIALAILAEVHAARSGRAGGPLRDYAGPIHAAPAEPIASLLDRPAAGADTKPAAVVACPIPSPS